MQYEREVLENIWREEILIRWENYWDSLGKRLKREEECMTFNMKTR